MDEGFARKYLGDEYDVHSAGIEAHGVNPKAIEAMKEIGIDISNQESAIIDDEVLKRAGCGNHALRRCSWEVSGDTFHIKRHHLGT